MSQSQRTTAEKTRTRAGKPVTAATPASSRPTLSPAAIGNKSGNPVTRQDPNAMEELWLQLSSQIAKLETNIKDNTKKTEEIIQNTEEIKVTAKTEAERLTVLLTDINKQHKQDIERLTDLLEKRSESYDLLNRNFKIVQHSLSVSQEKNRKLELAINELGNQARQCNLKIDGKTESPTENLQTFVTDLANFLGTNPDSICNAYRLGRLTAHHQNAREARPRPIMLTFNTFQDRNKFLFARLKLKDAPAYRGIYVNDDVTPLTHKLRDDFRSVAALARAAGRDIKVHGDGVIIDGTKYKHIDPGSLPPQFSLNKAKTIELYGGLYFQSEHSFMSNFHPSIIEQDNIIYSTAEHFFQAEKCRSAGDTARLRRVLAASTALEAKKIADQIVETPTWRNEKLKVMEKALSLKFHQNKELAKLLINTGNLTLHEATKNGFFGIGATLHSKELRDRAYKGLNKLGVALQELRSKLVADSLKEAQ